MNINIKSLILTITALFMIYLVYENDKLRYQVEQWPTTEQCLSICVEEFNRYGC